ncbi:unnamed protein product [Cylindrotheca closterium]|uniref:Uncharacterized protein n=1 Tax=Cylindrotheca closterium TaxID=2856 RepID=A0AAD2JJM6_9STRA|nr:unnamed protein product [Cylindrotheca closterium]
MSSFGEIRKSLSLSMKGKENPLHLNGTEESSSLSSNGNDFCPSHSPTQKRLSLSGNERGKKDRVSMSMKRFRKSFSAGIKLNYNKRDESNIDEIKTSSRPQKKVLDVRRQSLLERQDQLISEVLPEVKEKRRSKKKSRASLLDDGDSPVDYDTGPSELSSSKTKKKKTRKSSLQVVHDEYGENEHQSDEPDEGKRTETKQKKKRKSALTVSHEQYSESAHEPDMREVATIESKKRTKKSKRKSSLRVAEGLEDVEKLDDQVEQASGEKASKTKKKKERSSKVSHDAAAAVLDSSPKKGKNKLKKKKKKRKSDFTSSLLDDLELELGGTSEEDGASMKAKSQDEQTTDSSDSAPEMKHDMDDASGPMEKSFKSDELIPTLIEEEPNEPEAQSPYKKRNTNGVEAETTREIVENASGTMAAVTNEEEDEEEHGQTTKEGGPNLPEGESYQEEAENGAEELEEKREASFEDEKSNSAIEKQFFIRSSSLLNETNAHALSLIYGTSESESDDFDDDDDTTNTDKNINPCTVESKVEDAEVENDGNMRAASDPSDSQAINGSRDHAASELATSLVGSSAVNEVANDSDSEFCDEEQEEFQVLIGTTVEELGSDRDRGDVHEVQEHIQVDHVSAVGELGGDSGSEFFASDSDQEAKAEIEETVEESSLQENVNDDIQPATEDVLCSTDDSVASDTIIIYDEDQSAILRQEVEQLHEQLEQQKLKTKRLKKSVAEHKSNSIEQIEQIAVYKGMFEDLQEDFDMLLGKYNDQVEHNAVLLGLVGKMKHVALQDERALHEKTDRIQVLEEQLSILQKAQKSQILSALEAENERLRGMINLQKQSLFESSLRMAK